MIKKTHIQWTQLTWNPTTGCSKVSQGCKFCYAERWAVMQNRRGIDQYRNSFKLTLAPKRLFDPLKLKNPSIIFVNSMSDLFHEDVPFEYLKSIFLVMNEARQHRFQILTKRSERLAQLARQLTWTDNIWIGVSCESNDNVYRINHLLKVPSRNRFISFEPLIERIGSLDLTGISWVIVGGESNGSLRKVELEWILDIQRNCKSSRIPFFFKQWGISKFNPDKADPTRDKHHPLYSRGGCQLKGRVYQQMPRSLNLTTR